MPTYDPAPDTVRDMASEIMLRYPGYRPLVEAGVTIYFLFAFPSENEETGEVTGHAITVRGIQAWSLCELHNSKLRAMGLPDARITLDGSHWQSIGREEQEALLDHELYHLEVMVKDGQIIRDDRQRPKLSIRKHDHEIGWFDAVASRHGQASVERQQAQRIMEECGQFYWPSLLGVETTILPG